MPVAAHPPAGPCGPPQTPKRASVHPDGQAASTANHSRPAAHSETQRLQLQSRTGNIVLACVYRLPFATPRRCEICRLHPARPERPGRGLFPPPAAARELIMESSQMTIDATWRLPCLSHDTLVEGRPRDLIKMSAS